MSTSENIIGHCERGEPICTERILCTDGGEVQKKIDLMLKKKWNCKVGLDCGNWQPRRTKVGYGHIRNTTSPSPNF